MESSDYENHELEGPTKEIKERYFPRSSDVILVGKDGVRVHGYKPALVNGSYMLKSLLIPADGVSWSESKQTEISFPEFSSTAILPVVKYLEILLIIFDTTFKDRLCADPAKTLNMFHWDFDDLLSADIIEILEQQHTSWEEAFEVILAARFFLLHNNTGINLMLLEDIVFDYLATFVASTVSKLPDEEDMTTAAYGLSFLFEFLPGEGIRRCMNYRHAKVVKQLVQVLFQRPLEPVHLAYLSLEAFKHLLRNRHRYSCLATNFEEYLTLRNVLLWSVCQVSREEADQLSNHYLPNAQLALWLLDKPVRMERYQAPKDTSQYFKSIIQKSQLHKDNLASLLSHIDVRSVHPLILRKIVKPLDLFPPEQLSEAITSFGPIGSEIVNTEQNRWGYNDQIPIRRFKVFNDRLPFLRTWNDLDCIQYKGNGKGIRSRNKSEYDDQMPFPTGGGGKLKPERHRDQEYCGDFLVKFNLVLWRGCGSYEWDVIMETPRKDPLHFPEIGVEGPIDCQCECPHGGRKAGHFGLLRFRKVDSVQCSLQQCMIMADNGSGNHVEREWATCLVMLT